MECNKEEAMRAKEIAEKKMEKKDFEGARKIVLRARNLYPELENIAQLLCICDVHCSAQNVLLGSEKDFYGVLQLENFAEESTIRKQYRRLALVLHPDKNRFPGAESAFKLISEAHALLSDSTRRTLYDSKMRVLTRSAPVNPSNNVTKSSQPNKPRGARNNISNGYSNLNQQQGTQSDPSVTDGAFWTACPFCTTRYQYLKAFIRKSLCCPTCRKIFVAYEASVHGNASKIKSGQPGGEPMPPQPDLNQPAHGNTSKTKSGQPGGEHMPPKPDLSQPAHGNASKTKSGQPGGEHMPPKPDLSQPAHGKTMKTKSGQPCGQHTAPKPDLSQPAFGNTSKTKSSQPGGQHMPPKPDLSQPAFGNTSKTKSSQPGGQHMPPRPDLSQPAVSQGRAVPNQENKKTGVQNDKGTPSSHAGSHQGINSKRTVRPEPGVQAGIRSEGIKVDVAAKAKDVENSKSTKETDNKNTNSLHRENEGGISNGDATKRETENPRNKSKKRVRIESSESLETLSDNDEEGLTMEGKFNYFPRRSSRKRQHVSYQEENNVKEQKDALDSEDADDSDLGTKETGTADSVDAEPDEGVEIESDSDQAMSSSEERDIDCPDPEFSDFEKARAESEFSANQYWACYDTLDDMPRFYAKVKKVFSSPFKLNITWLEAVPIDEAYETWVDEELPVGCGSFKLGTTEKTDLRLSFSHRVHFENGTKRGSLLMYPREGEVWALFKDWDSSWSSEPDAHKENLKYEIVEVLSGFDAGLGVRVVYMDRVSGFVSLFQRGEAGPFVVRPNEVYRFSHRVPCFKMTGSEREGVPIGSFELDPASIPMNPDDLFYPGKKAKMEDIKMGPGVACQSTSNPAKKKKVKDEVFEGVGTTSPERFVDLEGTAGDNIEMRRSPRAKNVIRRNAA